MHTQIRTQSVGLPKINRINAINDNLPPIDTTRNQKYGGNSQY